MTDQPARRGIRARIAAMFAPSPAVLLAAETTSTPARIPTPRDAGRRAVNRDAALSLATVYRAVTIHATAATQLDLRVLRHGTPSTPPAWIRRPDATVDDRAPFIEHTVAALYLDGNAFWHVERDPAGGILTLTPWDPAEVTVEQIRRPSGRDTLRYHYRGAAYGRDDVRHLQLIRVPGLARGLGPIAACALTIRGALDARDYGAAWLTSSGVPEGVLRTDAELTPDMAANYKRIWYGLDEHGQPLPDHDPTQRTRVLGKGLTYEPLLIKPSDAQFLESQAFSSTEIARLFGIPAAMLEAGTEGGRSMTYSNVSQTWVAYVRFGLMKALREIETALGSLLPSTTTVRFNVDALERSDRKSRYEAHEIGLRAGFVTLDEVRAEEHLGPMPAASTPATTEPAPPREEPAHAD